MQGLAKDGDDYTPRLDPVFRRREVLLQRVLQFAPNNLTDGMWLSHISDASGTTDEVRSLLQHIYEDELGNGNPAYNHANVYRWVAVQSALSCMSAARRVCGTPAA